MCLKGRWGWGRNERLSGVRSDNRWRGRDSWRGAGCPTAGSQDRREVGPVILSKSKRPYRLWRSRRGRNAGARTWPCSTSVLLDDGFLQVTNSGNVATFHPHVDHGSSLTLRDLTLGFAFLLRNRWGQQAIVMLNKIHQQHWSQRVGKLSDP